ncbi:response regulator transcription factor [Streptomyces sp. M10(2022)]
MGAQPVGGPASTPAPRAVSGLDRTSVGSSAGREPDRLIPVRIRSVSAFRRRTRHTRDRAGHSGRHDSDFVTGAAGATPTHSAPHSAGRGRRAESVPRTASEPAGWRILVVDGDADFSGYLVAQLRRHGHESVDVKQGSAALQAHEDVDLVLLDLELPDLDGLEVCRAIRSVSRVPVIIVTSRQSELDCVLGLQAGADDYVTKPCGLRELTARIEAVMRRAQWQPAAVTEICHGRLHINVNSREVSVGGVEVDLTRKEFDLLCLLASHPDTVIPASGCCSRCG